MFPHYSPRNDPYRENAKEKLSLEECRKAFNRLIIFPGDDKLYERTVGYAVEVIDTQQINKGIYVIVMNQNGPDHTLSLIDLDMRFPLQDYLVDQGIEAIVNAQLISRKSGDQYFGLPVRRKPISDKT